MAHNIYRLEAYLSGLSSAFPQRFQRFSRKSIDLFIYRCLTHTRKHIGTLIRYNNYSYCVFRVLPPPPPLPPSYIQYFYNNR